MTVSKSDWLSFTALSAQLTLATLAAYDRSDWDRVNAGEAA